MEEEATDSGNSPMKETDMTDQSQSAREMVELADRLHNLAVVTSNKGRRSVIFSGPQLEAISVALRFAALPQDGRDPATIEACAKFVEQHQERISETANGSERSLSPRKVGNQMGLAYVNGIRALSSKGK